MFKPTLDVHDAVFESLNVDYLTKKLALGIDNETMKLSNVQVGVQTHTVGIWGSPSSTSLCLVAGQLGSTWQLSHSENNG